MPTDDASIAAPWSALQWDLNGDGRFTIGDIVLWLEEAFFLPGDWSIWLLSTYLPGTGKFLELDDSDYGGVFSGFVSAFTWLAALLIVLIVLRAIKSFDDAVTRAVRNAHDEGVRRARLAWAAFKYRLRRGKRRAAPAQIEFAEEIELSPPQSRVLERLLDVPAPYALSLRDIAEAQNIARSEAAGLVAQLKALNLVSIVDGGAYDDRACAITSAGRAYLVFRQLAPRG